MMIVINKYSKRFKHKKQKTKNKKKKKNNVLVLNLFILIHCIGLATKGSF